MARSGPTAEEVREYRREVVLSEYLRVCEDIRTFERQSDKILNIGVTVVSLSAVAGVSQKVYLVFFLVPIAVTTIVLYTVLLYFYIQSSGGYKRHLEDIMNETMKERILLWEPVVREREMTNYVRHFLLITYIIIAIGLISVSIYYIKTFYGVYMMYGMGGFIIATLPVLYMSGRELARINDKTYLVTQRLRAEPAQTAAKFDKETLV